MPETATPQINYGKDAELISKLNQEVQSGLDYQKVRHANWTENYELSRDHVETNRLTQRQAVNFPLIKETYKTILAKIDDNTEMYFDCMEENREGEDKEIVVNELWKYDMDRLNFEGLDIIDKKNVLMYGRSFEKLNFLEGKFKAEIVSPWDILVDPKTNPVDIETARWIVHQHIFKSAREIVANDKYDEEGKRKLRVSTIVQNAGKGVAMVGSKAEESLRYKDEAQKAREVEGMEDWPGADVMIELKEHYTLVWNEKQKKYVRHVVVYALDSIVLFNKPLEDVIGIEEYPFTTWGEDIDLLDFWTDGPIDLVRVPNKILNIYLSQMLESRTLTNYGMFWYDATNKQFQPQTYTPRPFAQLPVPGNPNNLIKQVEIPKLTGTMEEMVFIRSLVERATATTAIEKGVKEGAKITLGEVEILNRNSAEIINSLSKAYRVARKQFAEKWFKILEANVSEAETVTLYKKSASGKVYAKKISPKDWKSSAGYKVRVLSANEQENEKTTIIQKWIGIMREFRDDAKLHILGKKKILENMGTLTRDEIDEVLRPEQPQTPQMLPQQMPQPQMTPQQVAPEGQKVNLDKLKQLREAMTIA